MRVAPFLAPLGGTAKISKNGKRENENREMSEVLYTFTCSTWLKSRTAKIPKNAYV